MEEILEKLREMKVKDIIYLFNFYVDIVKNNQTIYTYRPTSDEAIPNEIAECKIMNIKRDYYDEIIINVYK